MGWEVVVVVVEEELDDDVIESVGRGAGVESVYNRLRRLSLGGGFKKMHDDEDEEGLLPHEKDSLGEVQSAESMLDAIKSKKPRTAYFSWYKDVRLDITQQLGGSATIVDVAKRAGEVWRELPEP